MFPKGARRSRSSTGTVARGQLNDDELLHTGKVGRRSRPTAFPFAITRADLDRGEERFNIYCSPCHGRTGEGNGMVVQRGYRQAALATTSIGCARSPAGYFFDVMTNGFGAMPDYRAQIPVEDRWRIVAYVRALQLSHGGDRRPTCRRPRCERLQVRRRRRRRRRRQATHKAATTTE